LGIVCPLDYYISQEQFVIDFFSSNSQLIFIGDVELHAFPFDSVSSQSQLIMRRHISRGTKHFIGFRFSINAKVDTANEILVGMPLHKEQNELVIHSFTFYL